MLSFFIEYSLRKYGFERLNSTFRNFDVLVFLLGFGVPPLFTGGWVIGCILFTLSYKMQTSVAASHKQ